MKTFLYGFATAIVFFPAVVLAYFGLGMSETRSDVRPPAWESVLMRSAVRASVRRGAAGMAAPAPASEESIIAGGKRYIAGCAGCHGEPGKPYEEDHAHYPPIPQLAHTGTQYSEPEVAWVIRHGVRMTGMSAYGPFYKESDLWAVAAFVRRINGLSAEEIRAIQPEKK